LPIVVQKYGGSSVADASRIMNVARRIVETYDQGNQVCAVVSARGDTTDELIQLAGEITPNPPEREMDMLLSAGERISCALLAMAIARLGKDAVSFTGSQAGIVTDTFHTRARILDIRATRLVEAMGDGKIALVAGFQGVSTEKDVTTLGRGGSDTTAVALAHALGADVCEIYTDVEGVYTANPSLVAKARKIPIISYDEMLELAAAGAQVLALRSVEYARKYNIPIHVRSSFSHTEGTWVREEDENMESAIIRGVTYTTDEAKVTVRAVPDRPGVAAHVFGALADAGVNVDMIIQNIGEA
jgi:aspartate kinase